MKLAPDPIGIAQQSPIVNQYVQTKIAEWQQFKADNKPRWWQFWKDGTSLNVAVRFLIAALDDLIDHVEVILASGPDKKATVLAAIAILYDFVVKEALPIWLWPFSGKVKQVIIYIIISTAIDWIVSKYRNGIWNSTKVGGQDGQATQNTEQK